MLIIIIAQIFRALGIPSGKESTYHAGDTGYASLIQGKGRSPGGGNGNPLQYSCLENPMDSRAWRAILQGVTKNQTRLSTHTFARALSSYHILCIELSTLKFSFINASVSNGNKKFLRKFGDFYGFFKSQLSQNNYKNKTREFV